jgi:hypothetical protein
MRLLAVLVLLTGAVATAQEQPVSNPLQNLPNRQKLLDNALRDLLQRAQAKPLTVSSTAARCGYIRIIPADPAIDKGIAVPDSKTPDTGRLGMPIYPGLPPCDTNTLSRP